MTAVPFINTPLGKEEEEGIKAHVSNIRHIGTDELERTLKVTEVQLIRFLDGEKHQRGEQRKLLNKLEQNHLLSREKVE